MVRLQCPRCDARFEATAGHEARCPRCGYEGGRAPSSAPTWAETPGPTAPASPSEAPGTPPPGFAPAAAAEDLPRTEPWPATAGAGAPLPPDPGAPVGQGWTAEPRSTNVLAVLSLIVGFVAILGLPGGWAAEDVFFGGFAFLFGIAAFILGVVAIGQVREQGQEGHGMAVAGVVLGTVAFALGFMRSMVSHAFAW